MKNALRTIPDLVYRNQNKLNPAWLASKKISHPAAF